MKRTPIKHRTRLTARKRLNRRTRMKRRNARRRDREFRRAYGSRERVQAVQAMPCLVCGALPSENAHVPSQSGAGRKGDARHVIPLCRTHHRELDSELGPASFSRRYDLDLAREAERVNATLED